jgi:hypothetical protein
VLAIRARARIERAMQTKNRSVEVRKTTLGKTGNARTKLIQGVPFRVARRPEKRLRRFVPKVPKTIEVTLGTKSEKAFERSRGIKPLRDVVQEAVEILNPNPSSLPRSSLDAEWLARMAIRSVAEAVIRQGCIPVPTCADLSFAHYPETDYELMPRHFRSGKTQPLETKEKAPA